MKIVHIISSFVNNGGAENIVIDLINDHFKRGDKIVLVVVNEGLNDLLTKRLPPISIVQLNRKRGTRSIFFAFKLVFTTLRIFPKVIHFHSPIYINFLFFLPAKKLLTLHTTGLKVSVFFKFDKIVSISNAVRDDLYSRIKLDSVVINNGVNTNKILIKEKETECKRILQLGRLDHLVKGQDLLIEAIHNLQIKYNHKVDLFFIGEGRSKAYLEELITKFNLSGRVFFLGSISRDELYQTIKEFDLLVQPSLVEGFGLTIIEAMAAKLPVLVSNIEAPMFLIRNGDYGYFFKVNNVNDLCESLNYIINNYNTPEIKKKIDDGYNYILDNFEITRVCKQYYDVYTS